MSAFPEFPQLPDDDPIQALRLLRNHALAIVNRLTPLKLFGGIGLSLIAAFLIPWWLVGFESTVSWASDFVPLAFAVLSIALTLKDVEKEHQNAVIGLIILFGMLGTVVLHLSRSRQDQRLDAVLKYDTDIMAILQKPPQPAAALHDAEADRRKNIEKVRRNDYILSHPGAVSVPPSPTPACSQSPGNGPNPYSDVCEDVLADLLTKEGVAVQRADQDWFKELSRYAGTKNGDAVQQIRNRIDSDFRDRFVNTSLQLQEAASKRFPWAIETVGEDEFQIIRLHLLKDYTLVEYREVSDYLLSLGRKLSRDAEENKERPSWLSIQPIAINLGNSQIIEEHIEAIHDDAPFTIRLTFMGTQQTTPSATLQILFDKPISFYFDWHLPRDLGSGDWALGQETKTQRGIQVPFNGVTNTAAISSEEAFRIIDVKRVK